ncbi:hypothetical protein QR680_004644 [Steinernema hermaphroditum]|uniref:Uncharacterized protein n=1 Tax=Steinernema hermaphroditum TaxID=289476 RepID=A0AA39LU10_9BILA|nr:hypothetical protein QR680_004644 [Steinernema hermaphroditum]
MVDWWIVFMFVFPPLFVICSTLVIWYRRRRGCSESECHERHCDRNVYVVRTDCERSPTNPHWISCERPEHCC